MNLVIFGDDMYTAAVIESLIEHKHKILLIIAPYHFNDHFKGLEQTASKYGIKFVKAENINSENIRNLIADVKPDLIIAAHLRKILRKEIFSLAAMGAINIHPSLLPRYRGLSPQHQAIMHGDAESGVTIHFIEDAVDTGDIIKTEKFTISKDEYIKNVQIKMLDIYKRIVVESLDLLKDPFFKPVKQDLIFESYFGPLKKSDREIDLTRSTIEVYNLVRAVSLPYKGAFYKNYTIWTAELAELTSDLENKYKEIGFYFDEPADKIIIKLKDGFLVSDDFEIN